MQGVRARPCLLTPCVLYVTLSRDLQWVRTCVSAFCVDCICNPEPTLSLFLGLLALSHGAVGEYSPLHTHTLTHLLAHSLTPVSLLDPDLHSILPVLWSTIEDWALLPNERKAPTKQDCIKGVHSLARLLCRS